MGEGLRRHVAAIKFVEFLGRIAFRADIGGAGFDRDAKHLAAAEIAGRATASRRPRPRATPPEALSAKKHFRQAFARRPCNLACGDQRERVEFCDGVRRRQRCGVWGRCYGGL